jgi:molecular chaperone IbpA
MTRLEKDFDDIVNALMFPTRYAKTFAPTGTSYPPYNLLKLNDETTVLEVAVAGFKEEEISVVVEDSILKITGKKENSEASNYIYKGIGTRAFERTFALSKDAKVDKAEYADGILSVFVSYQIPEEKKPKAIPISRGERLYLTEDIKVVNVND